MSSFHSFVSKTCISQSHQFFNASGSLEPWHIVNTVIIDLNTEIKSCTLTMITLIEIKEGGISSINYFINVAVNS